MAASVLKLLSGPFGVFRAGSWVSPAVKVFSTLLNSKSYLKSPKRRKQGMQSGGDSTGNDSAPDPMQQSLTHLSQLVRKKSKHREDGAARLSDDDVSLTTTVGLLIWRR
jgi:hypothetical protein